MSFETILYAKKDAVAYVTLNRPAALNTYNMQMRDDLFEALTAVRDDPDVRVLIISGAGKMYCAGADLSEFGTAPSPVVAREVRWERDVWGTLRSLNKVAIAAMHGHALGSGLELALLCDIRIAAEGTQLGLPEAVLGFIPAAGGTQSLPRVMKQGSAQRMILLGERIDAAEAQRIGLVNQVVPGDRLMAEADAVADKISAAGPQAVTLGKEAISRGLDLPLGEGLRMERRLHARVCATRDVREGVRAQIEGRRPVFRGV